MRIRLNPDKLDYELEFYFEKNEFFSEEILKISFVYDKTQYEPRKLIGTKIKWNDKEKNPSVALKIMKKKSKKNEENKTKEEIVPTFFDIFVDNDIEIDEFNSIALYAEFFRDEFIPGALEQFMDILNPKKKEDDEDNEFEEIEEEEEKKPKKKTKGKQKKKDADCKNQ